MYIIEYSDIPKACWIAYNGTAQILYALTIIHPIWISCRPIVCFSPDPFQMSTVSSLSRSEEIPDLFVLTDTEQLSVLTTTKIAYNFV